MKIGEESLQASAGILMPCLTFALNYFPIGLTIKPRNFMDSELIRMDMMDDTIHVMPLFTTSAQHRNAWHNGIAAQITLTQFGIFIENEEELYYFFPGTITYSLVPA